MPLEWDDDLGGFVRVVNLSDDEREWAARAAAREAEREAARRAEEERRAAEQAERERAAAEAKARAEELLISVLDEQQIADYRAHNWFTCLGSDGHRYKIKYGRQHNIFRLNDAGNEVVEICGHVRDNVPHEDNMAAQKLHLESDAIGFLRIANAWALPSRASLPRPA